MYLGIITTKLSPEKKSCNKHLNKYDINQIPEKDYDIG